MANATANRLDETQWQRVLRMLENADKPRKATRTTRRKLRANAGLYIRAR